MSAVPTMMRLLTLAAVYAITMAPLAPSHAQQATELQVSYSKGQFQPGELNAPADRPVTIRVKNLDAKAMEFESKSLRVEKVVAANSEGVINVRALKPGRYEFYDDFNEKARGALTVH
jgi:heme/copper-type cytochrome/quinol oxidase subunit 2